MKYATLFMVNLVCACCCAVCLFLFSCKKAVTVDPPIDKLTADAVFTTDETATAAVLGMYSQMMPALAFYSTGGTTIYTGLYADELATTAATSLDDLEFEGGALTQANGALGFNFWARAYRLLYGANACIKGLRAATSLTPALRDRLLGEALFIRAFHYHLLSNLFGDVPLVLSTAYDETARLPRTPLLTIAAQIVADLQEAKALLPATYATAGRIRPNKWAATALLARIYLYGGQWAAAEAQASELVTAGAYTLPVLSAAFLATSTETIWSLAPVESGFNTTEAQSFVPTAAATTRPRYQLRPGMLAAFESADARRTAWVGSKVVAGQTFYYPFKYKVRNIGLPVTENYVVLRYAEVLLTRAEARAQQGRLTEAATDLNTVRARASLAAHVPVNQSALLTAIEQERRTELFAEWGHRWFDLKRTGRAVPVLSAIKPGFGATALLWPLPQSELLRNPALTQNPGY